MSQTAVANTQPDVLSTDLKGFADFANRVRVQLAEQRRIASSLAVSGMETGRLICQFSATPEVVAVVDEMNAEKRRKKTGGREKEYHCFVADLLVSAGIGQKHWLEQCARAFKYQQENGLPLDTPVREALAEKHGIKKLPNTPEGDEHLIEKSGLQCSVPTPDRMLKAPKGAAGKSTSKAPPPTFKELMEAFTFNLDRVYCRLGETGLRSKSNQEKLADRLTEWFEQRGVTVEITFKA